MKTMTKKTKNNSNNITIYINDDSYTFLNMINEKYLIRKSTFINNLINKYATEYLKDVLNNKIK